ncbi:competence type IV pilus assembly protein ComGB [Latilactobacillus fuchuensis]|uniref:Competence protein n=1 Tax=Latilactobacillus fuchuensis TaxID=164393 RepID=A0A2N9DWF4_9LACO|nr:competence type IV pilus assembly protein ComGB [Latilactobacillus fuchuensis]SPC39009.1 Competence protein [Latilactobacillus fuchuensis]
MTFNQRRQLANFQAELLTMLGQLLQNGFSLKQAFQFLPAVFPKQTTRLTQINQQLAAGSGLAQSLKAVGFDADVIAQIELTELQGHMGLCLSHLGQLQKIRQKRRQELLGLLAYPLFLLVFLLTLIGLLRGYLLPEIKALGQQSTGILPLTYLLIVCLILVGIGLLVGVVLHGYQRRLPILAQLEWRFKLPFIGPVIQQYYQYYLVFDLATCLQNGLTLTEMGQLMQKLATKSWLAAVVQQLEAGLAAGNSLVAHLTASSFYPLELRLILVKGNPPAQLAKEVEMLADLKYTALQNHLKRQLSWLQPMLFILIGLIIICTYLSILLPLYQTMEGIA